MTPTDSDKFHHVLRILRGVAVFAFLWAIVVAVTGGFLIDTGFARFSSRDWKRPMLAAVVSFVLYITRYPESWRADLKALAALRLTLFAGICAAVALATGVVWGMFYGGGPDPSGYVSQADMWRRGTLTISAPEWVAEAPWSDAVWSSAPVGYRPQGTSTTLVPVYPPGFPLMMALLETLGGQQAMFYVVPVLGALAIWSTFLLGRSVAGSWAGAIAALLLLSSPPFLWSVIQPMSDVPATAWWAVALAFAWRSTVRSAWLAGAATAAAVLVRPNLVPLAVIIGLLIAVNGRRNIWRLTLFSLSAVPGPLVIAMLNWHWYGSPLRSGYGSLEELYGTAHMWPNVQRYSTWLFDVQTPVILLGFAAPFLLRHRASERVKIALLSVGFPLTLFSLYIAYLVFDIWQYLRFLLPAFPAVLVGVAAVLVEAVGRFRRPMTAIACVVIITATVALRGWDFARREGLFEYSMQAQSYTRAVSYVKSLPPNAILVSLVYSGTLRFYTGRGVLRWEVVNHADLDTALSYLRARGHPLYLIGDEAELAEFRRRFATTRVSADLEKYFVMHTQGFEVYDLTTP